MVGGRRKDRVSAAFTRFHESVARVLGAAAQLRDEAVERQAAAMVELWLRKDGIDELRSDPAMAR
ncbi:hypothetical protein, partial [Pseudonocardia pini]|uniref:hypothetical protein n=1 Tax=Pseudonocardia pini TaxID=2758030 RepID=UPI0015F07760